MSEPGANKMIMPSAGVHITLPDYYSPEHLGMIVPKTKDGRVVFMLPWEDATIAGTTGARCIVLLNERSQCRLAHAWCRQTHICRYVRWA